MYGRTDPLALPVKTAQCPQTARPPLVWAATADRFGVNHIRHTVDIDGTGVLQRIYRRRWTPSLTLQVAYVAGRCTGRPQWISYEYGHTTFGLRQKSHWVTTH